MNILEEIVQQSTASIEKLDLLPFVSFIKQFNPKVIVEIGTHRGGSADVWIKAFEPELFITIDSGPIPHIPPEVRIHEQPNYHYLWVHDSQTETTIAKVRGLLAGRHIDFLFLDGGHKFTEVLGDMGNYGKLVKPGGVIGMHDIDVTGNECQVPAVWQDFKRTHPYLECKLGPASTGLGLFINR